MSSENKNASCPCQGDCGRHGSCVQRIDHHREIGTLVACMRPVADKLHGKKEEA